MISNKRSVLFLFSLGFVIPALWIWHLSSGQIEISIIEQIKAIFQFDSNNPSHILVREFRIPRVLTATLCGASLAISGMLMQTLFRNPLAGPYILGINSGASLAVATGLLSGFGFMHSDLGIVSLALIGSFVFGALILFFSFFLRNSISLLLIGIMIGSFTSALTTLIQSLSSADSLKIFLFWGMGSVQKVEIGQIPFYLFFFVIGVIVSLSLIRSLNALVIGEEASLNLGISVKKVRILIILVVAILSGVTTAYCGPIAFVGLAIPNLCRMIFRTQNHRILIFANLTLGAVFMLLCDILAQYLEYFTPIPINVITSLIGAPFIIFIIFRKLA